MRLMALVLVVAALVAPGAAQAQYRGVRFEIRQVGDSTFTFPLGAEHWVKVGLQGNAVDPKRRDALVARFRVMKIAADEAVALITGQTTNVQTDHVAILVEPPRAWFRQRTFWVGLLAGTAVGASVALTR